MSTLFLASCCGLAFFLPASLSHMSFFSKDVQGHLFYHIRGTFSKFMLYLLREGYQIFLHTCNIAFSKMDLSKQWQLFPAKILLSPIPLQVLPHQDAGPWFVLTGRVGPGCSRGYCLYSDGSGSPSLHPLLLTPKTLFVTKFLEVWLLSQTSSTDRLGRSPLSEYALSLG